MADLVTSHDWAIGPTTMTKPSGTRSSTTCNGSQLVTDGPQRLGQAIFQRPQQLMAVRQPENENREVAWLLAEIRKDRPARADRFSETQRAGAKGLPPAAPPATVLPGEEAIQKALDQKNTFRLRQDAVLPTSSTT